MSTIARCKEIENKNSSSLKVNARMKTVGKSFFLANAAASPSATDLDLKTEKESTLKKFNSERKKAQKGKVRLQCYTAPFENELVGCSKCHGTCGISTKAILKL